MKPFITLLTILFSSIGVSAQNTDFMKWDEDHDGIIEHHEFTSHFIAEYYNSWEPDTKKGVIEESFFENSYAGLDTDGDNYLSDEEWLLGYNYFYDDYLIHEDYDLVDVNNNGKVTYQEYYDIIYDTDYFDDIDTDNDNHLSEYELADYVFENWDTNETGTMSRSEFERFDLYYLDV